MAYELELAPLLAALLAAGIPPLARDRGPEHPLILGGGPLTFSNPLPLGPFLDAAILGEAEDVVARAVDALLTLPRERALDTIESLPGGWVPERRPLDLPPLARAAPDSLPARSSVWSPDAALADMFLIEGERGCHRTCTFCVMRRATDGGMRLLDPQRVLDLVPPEAPRVGLVGAAISDHPRLPRIVEALVASGKGVGVSSLRADRVARHPELAELLRRGGYRTLTVASDAASQRLRRQLAKGTVERHLEACARLAARHGYDVLKVYMMLGVPGETEQDLQELVDFTRRLARIHRVSLGVAPFVAKRNTPLDGAPWAGIRTIEERLAFLRKGLAGAAEVRPTSPRWAWVEYVLAQGGPATGEAVLAAVQAGGRFSDFRRALGAVSPADHRPWAAA